MISEIIFDLETKSFFDEEGKNKPEDLGVSIVSLYIRKLDDNFSEIEGEVVSFWEKDFPNLWPLFEEADRVIGFNSKKFDVPALNPYAPLDLNKLPHFDILDEVKRVHGKRVSLDRIAKSTLGVGKIDVGSNAIVYWNAGDSDSLQKLQKYCEADTVITKNIYDHVLKNKELKFIDFWNTPHNITINFDYPDGFIPKSQKSQMGLF